jgi:3-hydroxy-5-methyl-1-naphthoate 3-O-methyltransferase
LQSLQTNKPFDKDIVKKDVDALSTKDIFETALSNQIAGEQLEMFTHAMYGVSVAPSMSFAKTFDFSKYKKIMDIGGGSGVYSIHVVNENPNMKVMVLDLEPACIVANQYIKRFGLEDRIQTKVFDFFKDEFPKDCDVAFLSHIIHQYSKDTNIALLKRIRNSLPNDNSAIIISEWFLNNEKTGPLHSALLGLTMILEHKEGRNYSYSEVSEMLSNAGFKDIHQKSLSGPADIIIGYKKEF